MNTIPNRYNKWLYLFHILVAKITRKTEITKKRSAVMLLFFKTIFRLILDEVCIIYTRYSVSFS